MLMIKNFLLMRRYGTFASGMETPKIRSKNFLQERRDNDSVSGIVSLQPMTEMSWRGIPAFPNSGKIIKFELVVAVDMKNPLSLLLNGPIISSPEGNAMTGILLSNELYLRDFCRNGLENCLRSICRTIVYNI